MVGPRYSKELRFSGRVKTEEERCIASEGYKLNIYYRSQKSQSIVLRILFHTGEVEQTLTFKFSLYSLSSPLMFGTLTSQSVQDVVDKSFGRM